MIKLIHMIDVNGTLKVTQGQRQNVKIKHAISVKLRRNLYLRGVNVLVTTATTYAPRDTGSREIIS